jgi:uncharacterized protein
MIKCLLLPLALFSTAACGAQARTGPCGGEPAISTAESNQFPLPRLTGRVVDQADLISAPKEGMISERSRSLEKATSDQLVVVTLTSLHDWPIEKVGLRLGNGWGVGRDDLDNGVLLIVAPKERKARIEVGCGLEGLLTDEKAQHIMDEQLVPPLSRGRFEDGIMAGVSAIDATLRSDPKRPQTRRAKASG